MSVNGGVFAPESQERERVRACCAKCRRGTKQFGLLPCGFALNCDCHRRVS